MPNNTIFQEGYSAFEAGLNPGKNPYQYGTRKFDQWANGFKSAHDEFIYDDLNEVTVNEIPEIFYPKREIPE